MHTHTHAYLVDGEAVDLSPAADSESEGVVDA